MKISWPTSKNTAQKLELALKKPAHAYIFSGAKNFGMLKAAYLFAAILLDEQKIIDQPDYIHPNLVIIEKNDGKKNIGISQIHELIRETSQTVFMTGKPRIVLIKDADSLGREASAALLKTLEEPQPSTLFILVTNNQQSILPTIRSRTAAITFTEMKKDEIIEYLQINNGIAQSEAANLAELSDGQIDLAVNLLDKELQTELIQTMQLAKTFSSAAMSEKFAIAKQVFETQKTALFLEKLYYASSPQSSILVVASNQEKILATEKQIINNVNQRLVLENLALSWSS